MTTIMKPMMLSSVMILCAAQVSPVLADQCAYITREQAEDFLSVVNIGDRIGSLCEPCGESPEADGRIPMTMVNSVKMSPAGNGVEISVNDEPIDLAYTYLVTDDSNDSLTMENAAILVGCPCEDVTETLVIPRDTSARSLPPM